MSLIYALVARGNTILAEFTDSSGNFTTVTQSILDRIPSSDAKCTYVYDRYLFHYIREDGIVYLCMGDEAFGRRIPFAFLQQVIKDFIPYKQQAAGRSAIAYSLNREFAPVLQREMASFSKQGGSGNAGAAGGMDKLNAARAQVGEVKDIMVQNIEKVLQRGEHIDILVDKTENLEQEANRFKKKATKLKKQMWWQNQKMCLILTLVLLIIALIIGLIIWSKTK